MKKHQEKTHYMTPGLLSRFVSFLREEERSKNTIEKYARYTAEFLMWLGERAVSKALVIEWKKSLQDCGKYAPATINAKLASVNAFLTFAGWTECKVKALRLQRQVFRDPGRDLTREEYDR